MAEKTIIQQALGINQVPVTVQVTIDGSQIFEGAVPTTEIPGPIPMPPAGQDAWSWSVDKNFWGTQTMSVTVQNGLMILCHTWINLPLQDPSRTRLHLKSPGDGFFYYDPLTAVAINGVVQNPPRSAEYSGQWMYAISEGDVLTCTVNIAQPTPA